MDRSQQSTTACPSHLLYRNVNFGGGGGTAKQLGPQPTALLQLAVLDDINTNSSSSSTSPSSAVVVFLFHLAHLTALPPTLRRLLGHRDVRKVRAWTFKCTIGPYISTTQTDAHIKCYTVCHDCRWA